MQCCSSKQLSLSLVSCRLFPKMTIGVNNKLLKKLVKEARITLVLKHFIFSYDFGSVN